MKKVYFVLLWVFKFLIFIMFLGCGQGNNSKVNEYAGIYIHRDRDTQTEIRIDNDGTFNGSISGTLGQGVLLSFSGKLEGDELIFYGNSRERRLTGNVSGNTIRMNHWTSLYGDLYLTLRKDNF